jgi:hypothetical protein
MQIDEKALEAAVEAGARAFHEAARDKGKFHWESASDEWRKEIRDLVRPVVVAALASISADVPLPR